MKIYKADKKPDIGAERGLYDVEGCIWLSLGDAPIVNPIRFVSQMHKGYTQDDVEAIAEKFSAEENEEKPKVDTVEMSFVERNAEKNESIEEARQRLLLDYQGLNNRVHSKDASKSEMKLYKFYQRNLFRVET